MRFGGAEISDIDILVNNLGIFEPKPFNKSLIPSGIVSSR
jgi:hypothetical protein